jgi:hypothetical protein
MNFDASFAATSVGSFPHQDPEVACNLVLSTFPEIPLWPQLPAISLNEQMEVQYSEGLPCVVIDRERERMYFDTGRDFTADLELFYQHYLSEDVEHFAISDKFARGISALEKIFRLSPPEKMKYIKLQVTGPISFALTVVDENKRAIYYNEFFRDVIVKGMAMKARWQMRRFKPLCSKQICIIDEPILSAFGSSTYVSLHRQDVVANIQEVVEAVHFEGGLAGIHCCGNTEWTIPIDADVDIISFDAYEYGDTIALYPKEIKSFMQKGGILAWGVVPTSDKFESQTTNSLLELFESLVNNLASKGIDRDLILKNSLLTASCGTGFVPVPRSERIAAETKKLSDRLKDKYHFLLN